MCTRSPSIFKPVGSLPTPRTRYSVGPEDQEGAISPTTAQRQLLPFSGSDGERTADFKVKDDKNENESLPANAPKPVSDFVIAKGWRASRALSIKELRTSGSRQAVSVVKYEMNRAVRSAGRSRAASYTNHHRRQSSSHSASRELRGRLRVSIARTRPSLQGTTCARRTRGQVATE
jgi:hypothetical protein